MAARADSNGGVNIVAANNSATRAQSGMRGTAMAATSTARTASQTTITERRGQPVGQVGQEQAADHPRQVAGRVDHGREQRRPGPVVIPAR